MVRPIPECIVIMMKRSTLSFTCIVIELCYRGRFDISISLRANALCTFSIVDIYFDLQDLGNDVKGGWLLSCVDIDHLDGFFLALTIKT